MANKRILYLNVQTSTTDPEYGVILSIDTVLDRKTKKDPIVTYRGFVKPTEIEWAWSDTSLVEQGELSWELLQTLGRPWQEVRDEFVQWLTGNGATGNKAIVIIHDAPRSLGFLKRYMGPELDYAGFPFDNTFDIRDYYSILVNRRQMPLLPERSLRAICQQLDAASVSGYQASAIKECYARVLELGVME